VIEAVFEDLELKHRVIRETEAALPEHAVFASNTSAIPIARLAAASKRPQQFVGMHYFSPVHKMPLVEIIRTRETAPEVVATAWQLCRQCGKTAIVVNDGVGFYTSRVISRYIQEGMWLLEEGAAIEEVDRAAEGAGFPVGPVTVSDEVGLDTAEKVGKILAEVFAGRVGFPAVTHNLVADGRAGRKNGRGFYLYRDGKKIGPDASAYGFTAAGDDRRAFSAEAIRERLLLAFCNEAALTLQENILTSPRDGDVGAVMGIGFPANLGGPFFYINRMGLARIAADLEKLEARYGSRYTPAPLLKDMSHRNKSFF
jgi:3-hydroxyacyl-CoA dehydrogenase/enoyl-CoA hydratase/3-hydroxybutyryl-CoA epimerase